MLCTYCVGKLNSCGKVVRHTPISELMERGERQPLEGSFEQVCVELLWHWKNW